MAYFRTRSNAFSESAHWNALVKCHGKPSVQAKFPGKLFILWLMAQCRFKAYGLQSVKQLFCNSFHLSVLYPCSGLLVKIQQKAAILIFALDAAHGLGGKRLLGLGKLPFKKVFCG